MNTITGASFPPSDSITGDPRRKIPESPARQTGSADIVCCGKHWFAEPAFRRLLRLEEYLRERLKIASSCAEQLIAAKLTIVSGYAAGTDIAVHKSALEHDGSTVLYCLKEYCSLQKRTPFDRC